MPHRSRNDIVVVGADGFHWVKIEDPAYPYGISPSFNVMNGSIVPVSMVSKDVDYFLVEPRYIGIRKEDGSLDMPVMIKLLTGEERGKVLSVYALENGKKNPFLYPEATLVDILKPYDSDPNLFYRGFKPDTDEKNIITLFNEMKKNIEKHWIERRLADMSDGKFALPTKPSGHPMKRSELLPTYANYYNVLGKAAVKKFGGKNPEKNTARGIFKTYKSLNPKEPTDDWNFGYLEAMAAYWRNEVPEVCHAGSAMDI
jgi:hypothetical protein